MLKNIKRDINVVFTFKIFKILLISAANPVTYLPHPRRLVQAINSSMSLENHPSINAEVTQLCTCLDREF